MTMMIWMPFFNSILQASLLFLLLYFSTNNDAFKGVVFLPLFSSPERRPRCCAAGHSCSFMTILSSVFSLFFIRFFIRQKFASKDLSLLSWKERWVCFSLSDSLSLFSSIFYTSIREPSQRGRPNEIYVSFTSHSSSRYVLRYSKLHLRPVRTLINFFDEGIRFFSSGMCSVCIISRRDEVEFYDGLIP